MESLVDDSDGAAPPEDVVARFVTTRATKILTVNAATATLLQRSVHFLVGKPLAVLLDVGDRPAFHSRLALLPEGGMLREWHVPLRARDGALIPTVATVEAVAEPPAQAGESQLRWSMIPAPVVDLASPANEALERLIADLVHELNQPLAAIVSYARGCVLRANADNLTAEVLESAMERIVAEALRASALLRSAAERWRQAP
jgi:signal transduction histidine kinase